MSGLRLVQVGGKTIDLPWLPTAHELGGWAPGRASTERPGLAPISTRASDPVQTQRIEAVVRNTDGSSVVALLNDIRTLAAGKPLVRVVIGSHDYGAFEVVDAGATVTDYASDGSPSRAEVMVDLRESVTAVAKVGPVKGKGKKR